MSGGTEAGTRDRVPGSATATSSVADRRQPFWLMATGKVAAMAESIRRAAIQPREIGRWFVSTHSYAENQRPRSGLIRLNPHKLVSLGDEYIFARRYRRAVQA